MPALYEPICDRCDSDSVIRLATEDRFGLPLCLAHAKAYDDREPPDEESSGPTLQERQAQEADVFLRERFK